MKIINRRVWKYIGIVDSIIIIVLGVLHLLNIVNFMPLLPITLGILLLSMAMKKITNG